MNCQWVQQNLSAYIDKELTADQKELIDSHLSLCAQCKSEFERLSMVWDSLSLWEDTPPPLYLKGLILGAARKKTFKFASRLLPVAAVFIIAISIFIFYGVLQHGWEKADLAQWKERHQPIPVESVKIEENEIIKNLQLIEEKDFYESVEILKTIDYLPLIEEHTDNRSSMGYYSA